MKKNSTELELCDYCLDEYDSKDIIHTTRGNYCEDCYDDLKENRAI